MIESSEISVSVLYFQSLGRLVGRKSETVTVPRGITLGDFFDQRAELYQGLRVQAPSLLFAVNQEQCSLERVLAEGDEVAFMPPFSGG